MFRQFVELFHRLFLYQLYSNSSFMRYLTDRNKSADQTQDVQKFNEYKYINRINV